MCSLIFPVKRCGEQKSWVTIKDISNAALNEASWPSLRRNLTALASELMKTIEQAKETKKSLDDVGSLIVRTYRSSANQWDEKVLKMVEDVGLIRVPGCAHGEDVGLIRAPPGEVTIAGAASNDLIDPLRKILEVALPTFTFTRSLEEFAQKINEATNRLRRLLFFMTERKRLFHPETGVDSSTDNLFLFADLSTMIQMLLRVTLYIPAVTELTFFTASEVIIAPLVNEILAGIDGVRLAPIAQTALVASGMLTE